MKHNNQEARKYGKTRPISRIDEQQLRFVDWPKIFLDWPFGRGSVLFYSLLHPHSIVYIRHRMTYRETVTDHPRLTSELVYSAFAELHRRLIRYSFSQAGKLPSVNVMLGSRGVFSAAEWKITRINDRNVCLSLWEAPEDRNEKVSAAHT